MWTELQELHHSQCHFSVWNPEVPVETPIKEVLQHMVVGEEPQQAIATLGQIQKVQKRDGKLNRFPTPSTSLEREKQNMVQDPAGGFCI